MKKSYERPTLIRRDVLARVSASCVAFSDVKSDP